MNKRLLAVLVRLATLIVGLIWFVMWGVLFFLAVAELIVMTPIWWVITGDWYDACVSNMVTKKWHKDMVYHEVPGVIASGWMSIGLLLEDVRYNIEYKLDNL